MLQPVHRSADADRLWSANQPRRWNGMYQTCVDALAACIEAIKPGVTAETPRLACQAVIDKAGYTANFRKRAGYSVGVSFPPDWGEGHIVSLAKGNQDDPPGRAWYSISRPHCEGTVNTG